MSTPPPLALAYAFAQLQSATTDVARLEAAGRVYVLAHPHLARRCTALLERLAPGHYLAGEDLASSALLSVVLEPTRAQACRSSTAAGILTFIHRVAYYDLQDVREVRDASARRAARLPMARMDLEAAAEVPAPLAWTPTRSDSAFMRAYEVALRCLTPSQQRAWTCCVEQEIPMVEVAEHFGVDRSTVWRHVRAAAVRLRQLLEPFRPRRRAPRPCALPQAPRPTRRR